MAGRSADEMVNGVETHDADYDQVDRNDVVQQPWHDQNQDARNQCNKGRDVGGGDGHKSLLIASRTIMSPQASGSKRKISLLTTLIPRCGKSPQRRGWPPGFR